MSRNGRAFSRSTSMSMPCPGTVGSSAHPSFTAIGCTAISSQAGRRLTKNSAIQKFGMTAAKFIVAASPTSVLL